MDKIKLHKTLKTGISFYKLSTTTEQQNQLLEFLFTLEKWNKVHNLTAIKQIEDMLVRHVLDSLSVASFLPDNVRVLDVGTGAGLPGIPLAIVRPDLRLVLVDSVQKKTAFVQHVITMLGLTNIAVVHARIEKYKTELPFDVIISRAFAETGKFISSCAHLCHANGFFVAMKGKKEQAQTESLPDSYLLTKIESVIVPEQEGERCLVFVRKKHQNE